jgi:large subunit ribosomal protein L35
MPKMKSHRGAKKRFRLTGTGKLRRRHNFRNHLLVGKSRKRKRALAREAPVSAGDERSVRRLLAK